MSTYKLLFLLPNTEITKQLFPDSVMEELESLVAVTKNKKKTQFTIDELSDSIPEYDFCITGWKSPRFTPQIVKRARKLKMILHSAGTIKPYISHAVFEKNIIVTTAQQIMSRTTAEAGIAMMMMGNWEVKKWITLLSMGKWKKREETVPGIQGKTIGIIGFGSITRIMLSYLAPYQFKKIQIYSKHLTEEQAKSFNVEVVSLNDLLSSSDIIFVQTSLTKENFHMLNRENLKLIKPYSLLVNLGRGDLIDEKALIHYLKKNRFRAVLDVFSKEPLPKNSPLRNMPNVISLPHIGAATRFCRESMGRDVVQNLKEYLQGFTPHSAVSYELTTMMSEK